MARRTPIHKWKVPVKGDKDYGDIFDDWFDSLDLDIEVRDVDANKGDYDPKDGAKFFATDSGTIYEGDGSSWNKLSAHGKYTDEEAQDAVGTILSSDFTYDDAGNAINMSPHKGTSDAHHTRYTDEESQDATNALLVGGNNVTLTYDDAANDLTIDASGGGLSTLLSTTITLDNTTHPAFDGLVGTISNTETAAIREVNVYADSAISEDWQFNREYSVKWDNSTGNLELYLTVNWDVQPNTNITARVEVRN